MNEKAKDPCSPEAVRCTCLQYGVPSCEVHGPDPRPGQATPEWSPRIGDRVIAKEHHTELGVGIVRSVTCGVAWPDYDRKHGLDPSREPSVWRSPALAPDPCPTQATVCPIGWRWHGVVPGTVTGARPVSGLSAAEQYELRTDHPNGPWSTLDWTTECWGHGDPCPTKAAPAVRPMITMGERAREWFDAADGEFIGHWKPREAIPSLAKLLVEVYSKGYADAEAGACTDYARNPAPAPDHEHEKARVPSVRQACRDRKPLDGADAQALEHALTITERERDEYEKEADEQRSIAETIQGVLDAERSAPQRSETPLVTSTEKEHEPK